MDSGRMEYTFLWFIENYSYSWHEALRPLYSPRFNADKLQRTSWSICMHPSSEDKEAYISLLLYRNESNEGPYSLSPIYELSVLDANGSTLKSNEGRWCFTKMSGNGWPTFAKRKDVPEGTLAVRCRIWDGEGKVHKIPPICARTRIAVEDISFLHVLKDFSTRQLNLKDTALIIQSHSQKEFAVSVSLYFDRDSSGDGEMMLEIKSLDSNHILWKLKVSLVDLSGNLIPCGKIDNLSDVERKDIQKLALSLTRKSILNHKSDYLPGDELSLLCDCTFSTGIEFEKIEGTSRPISEH